MVRVSGVLLHPTSLPSVGGIGDLGKCAYEFIDFLATSGQQVWQILPLGPTELACGSSPYMCASAFAGNPLLISTETLLEEGLLDPQTPLTLASHGNINFKAVLAHKMRLLKLSFVSFLKQPQLHKDWQTYCQENQHWLEDYALFTAFKSYYGDASWNEWPLPLAARTPIALREVKTLLQPQVDFHCYVQYQFERQWSALHHYARQHGIRILGDLPIYVAYDSADVWAHRELFELADMSEGGKPLAVAGVPPDYFSETGQLWGNPLYDWDTLQETDYHWWVERVRATLRWVDWVRLDHFRGFESYWRVPATETTAINGVWATGPGAALFTALERQLGQLPVLAEDLGVITPQVEALRDKFKFPGMRILQFAFNGDSSSSHIPFNYHPNTVVYTGTHDNDTCIGWRDDPRVAVSDKQNLMLYLGKDNLDQVQWDFIRLALQSIADTAIFPLQDVLGLGTEHRMNRPGTATNNWAWRYRASQLTPDLAAWLLKLTHLYGRS